VAGYTEARTVSAAVMPTGPLGSLTPCSLMIAKKSNHVGTVRGVLETMHLRGRPPKGWLAAPDTARMRGWERSPISAKPHTHDVATGFPWYCHSQRARFEVSV
jgi:hypothetical protein